MSKVFHSLKVVELASVLAGPSVGMFFAELGAEVIKIENKNTGGDVTRSWKLAGEDQNHPYSAYYSSVNYGKQSLFLNLKEKKDHAELIDLIKRADILIVNFKYGDAEKLQLDFESICKVNPTIVYGAINGFGSSERIAYDVVLQAESGFISMNGTKDGTLCKMPVALIDLLAAHQLKEGILIALLEQQQDNMAKKVSVSLFNTAVSSLANQATNWLMADHIAQPMGTLHPNIAPYGELFLCKDEKQIVLAVGSDTQFSALCNILSLPELIQDTRFAYNQLRVKNRKALAELLSKQINQINRNDLMRLLIQNNVPAGAVRTLDEVFELSAAQTRIIEETKEGELLKTVKGNAFKIESVSN